jgi:hypothetical protein
MNKVKIIIQYFIRVLLSVPFIGASILDALLLILHSLEINITFPAWVYAAFLALGFLIENIRIFIELQISKEGNNVILGLYHQNHEEWGDSIKIIQLPNNPNYQPSFGLVLSTVKPNSPVKGVVVRMSFYWRGDPPKKTITISPPKNDIRWRIVSDNITQEVPATFSFDGKQEVVSFNQPVVIPNFSFHLLEHLKGYFLIRYEITSLEPSKTTTGELVIKLTML